MSGLGEGSSAADAATGVARAFGELVAHDGLPRHAGAGGRLALPDLRVSLAPDGDVAGAVAAAIHQALGGRGR